jgi:hypothetical protein
MSVAFDWSIRFGDVLTILVFAVGALGFLYTLRGEVKGQGDRIKHIEADLGKFVEILVTLGKQDERLKSHDLRIADLEKAAPRVKRR